MGRTVKAMTAGVLAGAALTVGSAVAQADSWHPWVPGIPDIGIPGIPLPPGQVKQFIPNFNQFIPNLNDLVPNW